MQTVQLILPTSSTAVTMHERNPYKTPPEFDTLALAYPPLRPQSVSLSPFSDAGFAFIFIPLALSARPRTGCPQSTFTTKRPKGHPKSPTSVIPCRVFCPDG